MLRKIINIFLFIVVTLFALIPTSYASGMDKYVRWSKNKMPLSVYIDNGAGSKYFQKSYPQSVISALNEWKNKSGGVFSYKLVTNPSLADIKIQWVDKLSVEEKDTESEHSWYWGITKLGNPTVIKIVTKHPLNANMSNSAFDVYLISMHELGHAMGIWWHTRDPQDIMYKNIHISSVSSNGSRVIQNVNKGSLSQRDVSNLKALYNKSGTQIAYLDNLGRSTFYNASMYESSTNNLETTGIAGASVKTAYNTSRVNFGDAQKNLKSSPNSPEAYNNMGLAYLNAGNYDQAIESFSKALGLRDSYGLAHYNIALAYKAKGDYKNSADHFRKFLTLNPSTPDKEKIESVISRMVMTGSSS